ncbi:MAG: S-layer homology domain-containing protein [Oscillospiraceae bacterium]|nr:S-layer homology domain-containing protein [Oscillospiraceae bacterium]
MKRFLSLVLALAMLSGFATVFAAGLSFADVKESDWFYNDVKNAVEMGLVNGKSETRYAPNDNLTYAEAIKLAACMNQYYTDKKVTLKNGNPWYQTYVDYCIDKEIISKFANYNYTALATRDEFLNIFANALPEEEFVEINNVPMDSIPDYHGANSFAPEIYMLYRAGVLAGVNEKHEVTPKANIMRSEVAAVITRMMIREERMKFSMGEEEKEPEVTELEVTEPEVKEPETTEPEATEPEAKEPEVTEPENNEAENTENTSPSVDVKDKFEQTEDELKNEDFKMTIQMCNYITADGVLEIAGKITGGKVNAGDTIYINDENGNYLATTKVTCVVMFKKKVDEAKAGDTAGLRIDLDVETWKNQIASGFVASATKGATSSRPALRPDERPETDTSTEPDISISTRPATPTIRE